MGPVRRGAWKWFKAFMDRPSFNPKTGLSSPDGGGPMSITDEDLWREGLSELKDDVRSLRTREAKGTDDEQPT